jgi:hypothetical protein
MTFLDHRPRQISSSPDEQLENPHTREKQRKRARDILTCSYPSGQLGKKQGGDMAEYKVTTAILHVLKAGERSKGVRPRPTGSTQKAGPGQSSGASAETAGLRAWVNLLQEQSISTGSSH